MARIFLLLGVMTACGSAGLSAAGGIERPRLGVLTDIGGDPDDQQSLIRLLVYANEFDLELLLATAAGTPGELTESVTRPDLIRQAIAAYREVLPNLRRHAERWPAAEELLERVQTGNPRRGLAAVGKEHDTAGSRAIVRLVDQGSPERPLHLTVWGGQTDLAQAFWRVKQDRGLTGWQEFAARVKVFDINDQDRLAEWLRREFPGMWYILSQAPTGRDKREGTYRGMYLTGDESLTSREWVEKHIRSRSPLGALYPVRTWTAPNPHSCLKEGDTPAWFFFLPRGGNRVADPGHPGWGGQYERQPDGWYHDLPARDGFDPRSTVSRWRAEFQADFARRMAWTQP